MKYRELGQKIRRLRHLAPRSEWVAATQEVLLAEIRRQGDRYPAVLPSALGRPSPWRSWRAARGKVGQPVAGFAAVLGAVLATSLTVNAAFYSLPGQPLYRLKLAFERTQLALVADSARKTELKVEFARNRVKELGQMVAQVTPGANADREVSRAVGRFTREMASVRQDLQKLPADRRAVFKIAVSVDQASSELAEKLQSQITPAQPEVNAAVKIALATAEDTSSRALEAAIAASGNATSSHPLPTADIRRHFDEKIARLRYQVTQLAPRGGEASATVVQLQADLGAAEHDITVGDFSAALSKISAIKETMASWEQPPTSQGAPSPDGTAGAVNPEPAEGKPQTSASSTAAAIGGEEASEGQVETTQGFLP